MYDVNRQLLDLLQKYPNANIYTFTNCEVVADDYGYWLGNIKKIYYGKYYMYNDNIYFSKELLIEEAKELYEDNNYLNKIKEFNGIIIKIGV